MSQAPMVSLEIDGRARRVPAGTTVLKAAEEIGIVIPRFCYHPAFEPEGSCRMCLVEIEGLPKLDLACSTVVREGMKVWTSTPKVLQARKDVLEFLLADHPLDCPICDKAGECFLQEYYDKHGRTAGRFLEAKEKKGKKVRIGRRLLLDRERCVLCTRCVRFLRRVTGTGELGVFDRGVRAEIGIDGIKEIDNNYSGNLVDICPVGAITDTEFRFQTRAWFLRSGRTVCPRCGRGCNIFVQSVRGYPLPGRTRKVYRVVPAENPAVNGHWICDFGRYGYREIGEGRLTDIIDKRPAGNPDGGAGWEGVLKRLAASLRDLTAAGRGGRIAVVVHSALTSEELGLARKLFGDGLRLTRIFRVDPRPGQADGRLLVADRVPNRRGAEAQGFVREFPGVDELFGSSDLLVIFGTALLDYASPEEIGKAARPLAGTYLLSSHRSRLEEAADVILPTAHAAEKSGTFTNVDGISQSFACAVPAPAGCLAEGDILTRLAGELGVPLE